MRLLKPAVVLLVCTSALPLCCLFIHDQRDVALDQGEREESNVAGVLARRSRLLWPGREGVTVSTVQSVMDKKIKIKMK